MRRAATAPFTLGVISDTHGLLRPEALDALRGSDLIVHAGDIGDAAILEALATVAPVVAVRGNNDRAPWADAIPTRARFRCAEVVGLVLHDIAELDAERPPAGAALVVTGHSHRPVIDWRGDVLFLNPGSAGPRRFTLPIAIARVDVVGTHMAPRIVDLSAG